MAENPRIEALRRRVEKDPKSIAFAQLAEEYRRTGVYKLAIDVCRDGLRRHPGYLSAQVTLGRALIELGQLDEARAELEAVLSVAPDNLAAIRALAYIHQRHDDAPPSLSSGWRETRDEPQPQATPEPADGLPATEMPDAAADIEPTPACEALTEAPAAVSELPVPDVGDLSVDALDLPPLPAPPHAPAPVRQTDPAVDALEQWLAAIVADRSRPR
jgi:tetratricopeptide (TPR) repeat protein